MDDSNEEKLKNQSNDSCKTKERKHKRADIQIYRPGALRLMKKATEADVSSNASPNLKDFKDANVKAIHKENISSNVSKPPKDKHVNSSSPREKHHMKNTLQQSHQENVEVQDKSTLSSQDHVDSKKDDFKHKANKNSYSISSKNKADVKKTRDFNMTKPQRKTSPKETSSSSQNPDYCDKKSPDVDQPLVKSKDSINNKKKTFFYEKFARDIPPLIKQDPLFSASQTTSHKNEKLWIEDAPSKLKKESLINSQKEVIEFHSNKRTGSSESNVTDSLQPTFSKLSIDSSKNSFNSGHSKHNLFQKKISRNNRSSPKNNCKDINQHKRGNNSSSNLGKNQDKKVSSRTKVSSFKKESPTSEAENELKIKKSLIKETRNKKPQGSRTPHKDLQNETKPLNEKEIFSPIRDDKKFSKSESKVLPNSVPTFARTRGTSFQEMKYDSSLESSSDELSGCDSAEESVNPMIFMEFENSCNKNSWSQNPVKKIPKSSLSLSRSPENNQNVRWADEKWSPFQKQGSKNKKPKDLPLSGSPIQRGIIQVPATLEPQQDSNTVNQKVLFNPNNPSKPLIVTSSARDASSGWDNASYTLQEGSKTASEDPPSNNMPSNGTNDSSNKIDPSIFYNIQKGEMDINYYVSSNQLPQEFRRIMDIRLHLQGCYSHLLVSDIRLCQEKNIEAALWKSLFYVIIEKLREYINKDPSLKDRSLSTLHMLVDEGQRYFQGLLNDLQQAYDFSLDDHLENDLTLLPSTKNRVKQAIHSCQKILLSIGDLARYKEQYSINPNFCVAKNWYQMALQVQPRNGRPFNQLAIIAVSLKRPLDVVYYYVRSLSAANPFTSARDSLISMFDDIRKKYESTEKKPVQESKVEEKQRETLRKRTMDNSSLRQEIWIRPDSGATNKRTLSQSEPEEESNTRIEELLKQKTEQLMKSFLTCYLHCHGMLFSKVGLDHFTEVLGKTLDLFQALLKQNPPRMSPIYLLQIMAINMFAIENTQLKDSRLESGYRSAAQDLALLLGQEMFARLAEIMVQYFPSCINYNDTQQKCPSSSPPKEDTAMPPTSDATGDVSLNFGVPDKNRLFLPPLAVFVPAAKVWCDWLLYQSLIWNPPPTSHDLPPGLDAWAAVGELATIVKGIGTPDLSLFEEDVPPPPNFQSFVLPEDKFLRGYSPILTAQRSMTYAPNSRSLERARDWLRMKRLQVCLSQFLCGVEPPILRLQKTDKGEILVPVVADTPPATPSVMRDSLGSRDSSHHLADSSSDDDTSSNWDEEIEDLDIPEGEDRSPLASTVRLLAHRKKLLEKKHKQQRKLHALMEGSVTLQMEVRPRYLVPDTNCFIEHLHILKALINKTPYILMIPLVVLNELKGLAKDAAVEKYGDVNHALTVRENSSSALDYLKQQRNNSLKYVTSEGSILQTSTFTDELNIDQDSSNDDKILSCCINFCSSTNKQKLIKDGMRHIYREVVLLTEDRNLRVKAYARDVPVRDLLDFAHWAGIK